MRPLINPDLLVSLSDTLEEVMQASLRGATILPIEGVSVSDWGQGSDPPRILGVRWLDPGLAGEERGGMEAEEGDFLNIEVALSYRARSTIWTEIHSFIGITRLRFQLNPDPPFFCRFPNIMDIPIISRFIQKSIDAATGQYVAPRSLTLNLKQMIMGDDVKIDTVAKGVIIVIIHNTKGFKDDDGTKKWSSGEIMVTKGKEALGQDKENDEHELGGGDAYITVTWSKFGKSCFKTRLIANHPNPAWEENTAVLVGPDELNASERLCLQLWDSEQYQGLENGVTS
ncbi:hypothetical protein BDZ91DRAFT_762503 [Kalaharituber pfeilii]|nr:hypothetical protein BDZ91DRAFT_762503 [Kalaharituber pfeilii]